MERTDEWRISKHLVIEFQTIFVNLVKFTEISDTTLGVDVNDLENENIFHNESSYIDFIIYSLYGAMCI